MRKLLGLICNNCGYYHINRFYEDDLINLNKKHYYCSCENPDIHIVEFEDIQEPDVLLNWAESELEDANYHSQTDLPGIIYSATMKYVDENHYADLARAIAESFVNNI